MSQKLGMDYVSESKSITSTTPLTLNMITLLGNSANIGWIVVDTGSITVQINGISNPTIPLSATDTLRFIKEDGWNLKTIYIKASSSATIRYFFKKKDAITL